MNLESNQIDLSSLTKKFERSVLKVESDKQSVLPDWMRSLSVEEMMNIEWFVAGFNDYTEADVAFDMRRYGLKVQGIINDRAPEGDFEGIPFCTTWDAIRSLKKNTHAAIASVSTSSYGNFLGVQRMAKGESFRLANHYQIDLFLRWSGRSQFGSTLVGDYFVDSILASPQAFLDGLQYFDQESQKVYLLTCMARLTCQLSYFWQAYSSIQNQYFEDFLSLRSDEVFVDGGSFNADDTVRFLRKTRNQLTSAHLFELDPLNISEINKTLSQLDNTNVRDKIHVHNNGLWMNRSSVEIVGLSTGSHIKNVRESERARHRGIEAEVGPLDDYLERATLIKLEIEGAEKQALLGAKRILREHRPRLAVMAYHLADDLIAIPKAILEIEPRYKLKLRHYSGGYKPTVIYAQIESS